MSFNKQKKQKIKYLNHINDNQIKFEVSLHFGGDLAFCAPSDVFYDWEWKWSTLNWGVKRQPLPPSAPRAAAASRGTTAAQKNLFEPVSNFSDLVLANGCTLEYAIFLDYATFAYVHIRGNFLFRSVSGP